MFFIEDSDFLTDEHKQAIEAVRTDDFPYFYQPSFETAYYEPFTHVLLCHILILRQEERKNNQVYNSVFSKIFEDMLVTFCNKNQVEHNETLRGAINLTFNNGQGQCFPHVDHVGYHKQLLIYLNDPADKESHTVILDEDTPLGIPDDGNQKQLKRVVPEKYKGVCFENLPHYQVYPKFGERIVSVFTFR